jgi:hypothetical protein
LKSCKVLRLESDAGCLDDVPSSLFRVWAVVVAADFADPPLLLVCWSRITSLDDCNITKNIFFLIPLTI